MANTIQEGSVVAALVASDNLLHKQGFVDSQIETTVIDSTQN